MKCWKIKSSRAWSQDCAVVFIENRKDAIERWRDIDNDYTTSESDMDIEEWDVQPGDVIIPEGYDDTDAYLDK